MVSLVCHYLLQELVLNIIPNFANMIEYSAMKHSVIPRIKSLCLQTTSLSVSTSEFTTDLYTKASRGECRQV